MNATAAPPSQSVIHSVTLRTANAERMAGFYRQVLGLVPDSSTTPTVSLRHPLTGDCLLTLIEDKEARPAPEGAPGLFHIAFLIEEIEGWRAAVNRALALAGSFHGASDHGVSWAVYLDDPDGNGLEFAWDKPSNEWPWRGNQIQMVTHALPLRSILLAGDFDKREIGAFRIGHLHLQVSDLREADAYQKHLGFHVTKADYPGAVFLARGRYHHHLAINNWRTNPQVSRPENATGLVGWEMLRDAAGKAVSWRDPSGSLVSLLPS